MSFVVIFGWAVKNWKLVVVGALVAALAVQSLRLNLLQASVAKEHAAQLAEIARVQAEADEWSNRLIAKQAEKTEVRTETRVQYIDRIHNVPTLSPVCDDPRTVLGNHGVRDILLGKAKAK
jgi:hypothetical protein